MRGKPVKFAQSHDLPMECGRASMQSPVSKYIYHGEIVKIEQYPWMAELWDQWDRNNWGHACGASILNRKWLLTAAHCFDAAGLKTDRLENPLGYRVRVGLDKRDERNIAGG